MDNYDEPFTVFVVQTYDYGDWIPENLSEAIFWLQIKLEQVPPEYRDTAKLEIESEYESSTMDLSISYERPPTEDEKAERRSDAARRVQAVRERAERDYERLKDFLGK